MHRLQWRAKLAIVRHAGPLWSVLSGTSGAVQFCKIDVMTTFIRPPYQSVAWAGIV